MMKKREWLSLALLTLTVAAALLINIKSIYMTGGELERLLRPETKQLLMEIVLLFLAAFGIQMLIHDSRGKLGALVLVTAVFTWMHQAFLPVVVSGLYLVLIIRVGSRIRCLLIRETRICTEFETASALADFTFGSVFLILLYCLMSLAGVGSIAWTRAAALLAGGITFLPIFPGTEERKTAFHRISESRNEKQPADFRAAAMVAFIFALVLLQVGRMNICADYDSLHYGLRSEYVLNDGGGIYENLGSINVVYTYSKGLETLLLPISGLPSYSFFLSFQIWMAVGILAAAAEIVKMFAGKREALFAMTLLASIPAIMNMGITAKTDLATALFQLIMAHRLLLFVKQQRTPDLAIAGNAFLMSMVLKPTSIAFSTILAGTVFLYLLFTHSFKVNLKDVSLLSWIGAIVMWLLIWYRTWMLTGLPVTSVFTSIWTKLGFTVKYPFLFDELPTNGGGMGIKGALKHFLKRLYGVLLAPVGDDMAHVRIAWGTSLLLIFLVLFLTAFVVRMKKETKEEMRPLICLGSIFFTNGLISLVMLHMLWQVDGNYFILQYCLFVILAAVVISKFESRLLAGTVRGLLIPVLLFNLSYTAISNWNGTLGLSPVAFAHYGYYDHWAEAEEEMEHKGNVEIWDILAENPETRVLVYGEQPEMLMFPCNAQSYTDIAGSGGNYYVSASVQGLVDFFTYAKIDYVYLCGGYLKPGTEAWNFVVAMIESGYLTDLFYENGHVLARFKSEPAEPENPEAVLYEFAQCYFPGEQQ